MENALQTFLHMPMPMATALLIMAAIAAFLFVKLLALLLMPVLRSEHLLVIRRPAQPRTQPAADQAMPRVKASAPAKSAVAAGKRRMPRRDEHGKFVSAC